MSAVDYQFGIVNEATYNTLVTVSRFFYLNTDSDIKDDWRRTISSPLLTGSYYVRDDKFVPYQGEAAGTINIDVLSRGFGYWIKHMVGGSVSTTGPTDTVYTHTFNGGDFLGNFFTAQFGKPFHPSGTVQPFTFGGGKIPSWTIQSAPDGMLIASLDVNFASTTTATGLASASYPAVATTENLSWAGGVITIGGSAVDLLDLSIKQDNQLNIDRRFLRGNTAKKEQSGGGKRQGTFELTADFTDLTQYNRVASLVRANTVATVVGTWTGLVLAGTTTYPSFAVTLASCRFDDFEASPDLDNGISQKLTGEFLAPSAGGNPVSIVYKSLDSVP